MGSFDLSKSALRLQQIDDPEDTADEIDRLVADALSLKPKTALDCASLIDLIVSGLERDEQPRSDGADIRALRSMRDFLLTRAQ